MQDVLTSWLEETKAPGISLAIDDGNSIRSFNAGVADVRTGFAVGEETTFQLGSVSKVITAFVLLEVMAARGLSVDTPVIAIAPDLKASNERAFHDMTVRHLLNHTSGLESQWWVDLGRGDCARKMAARAIAATPLLARPGELFSYSGPAFILAGYLTEVLCGRCWEEQMRMTVAAHIGDHSITARPEEVLMQPSATGYVAAPEAGRAPVAAARWYAPLALSPGGGLVATTADLARLTRAMRHRFGLDASAADPSPSSTIPTIGWRYDGWGLGMAKYPTFTDLACWGHDGTTSGQAYAVRLAEGRGQVVSVATNAVWAASRLGKLAEDVLAGLLGDPARLQPAAGRTDALSSYTAWRLPAGTDIAGTYLRLNATMQVRAGSEDSLVVEEIASPQDEENWFGGRPPHGTGPIRDELRRAGQHSYESASRQLHFMSHPDDSTRLYVHNGMRVNVRTPRPWA
ncbi:serine hydrolase domain-containing protein [Rhizobium sp. A37_96]